MLVSLLKIIEINIFSMESRMTSTIFFTQAYNARNTIRRTVNSVLNQTHGDFEYFLFDNGSTDDTEEIILEYAMLDKRIKPIHINYNHITNGGTIWATIIHATYAKYVVWCDADDEYTPDFLENMISFMEDNNLDIASCGYEKVDGFSNEVIKRRTLDKNLIIHDNLFTEEFIKYRGFTAYTWGKLYSVKHLRSSNLIATERKNRVCNDSIWTLGVFREAARAGVYGKAMYKYYQYPRSLSNVDIESNLSSFCEYWHETKKYLEHYGPISKINEDFLYAIHLSLVEEAVDKVFASELSTSAKLSCLDQIFKDPVWKDTMTRNADQQFKNLAARGEYVNNVKNRILALPVVSEHREQAENTIQCLSLSPKHILF